MNDDDERQLLCEREEKANKFSLNAARFAYFYTISSENYSISCAV